MDENENVRFQGAVKMPNEIKNVKNTVIFGLTGRQLLGSLVGLALMAGLTFLFTKVIKMNGSMAVPLSLIVALPAFLFGFLRPGGLDIEDWLVIQWSNNFKSSPIRKMSAENRWNDIERIGIKKQNELSEQEEYRASGKKKAKAKTKAKKPKKKKEKKPKSQYIVMR